jgi:hypothetical protein
LNRISQINPQPRPACSSLDHRLFLQLSKYACTAMVALATISSHQVDTKR